MTDKPLEICHNCDCHLTPHINRESMKARLLQLKDVELYVSTTPAPSKFKDGFEAGIEYAKKQVEKLLAESKR